MNNCVCDISHIIFIWELLSCVISFDAVYAFCDTQTEHTYISPYSFGMCVATSKTALKRRVSVPAVTPRPCIMKTSVSFVSKPKPRSSHLEQSAMYPSLSQPRAVTLSLAKNILTGEEELARDVSQLL